MSHFEYKRDLTNLPPKIRCDVGKEWKTPDQFSKTKLHQFANSLRHGNRVSASKSGIACRVHSGEPETTLQCNGPCGKTYGLDRFSRNTRIRGVFWCNDCTDWQGKNEPGFMPYPVPFAPRTGDEGEKDAAIKQGEKMRNDDDTQSVTPSAVPSGVAGSYAPSVTTERVTFATMSADYGGPAGSSAGPTTEGSVFSDDTYNPNAAPRQYNAWGPDGVLHRITKTPTVISEISTASTAKPLPKVTASGWVKPSMRKTPAEAPGYIRFGRCNPTLDDDYHSVDGLSDDEI